MKRKLLLACLFIAGMVATQAQNLIKNGSFENGEENWFLQNAAVRNYNTTVDGTHYLQSVDSYSTGYYNARAKYTQEVATNVGGKTYRYSVWIPKTTDESGFKGQIRVKDTDGKFTVYNSVKGQSFGALILAPTGKEKEAESQYGKAIWKEIAVEFQLPDNALTIAELALNMSKKGLKADNIEFVEVKSFTNLTVTNYQREVLVTWDAASGTTSYTVQVDSKTPTTVTDSKFFITGLEPNTALSVTVSAEGFSTKTLSATTADFGASEINRIPYVNFTDGTAPTSFYPSIFDSTNAPTDIKVFLDGTEVTAGADGLYTLTAGDNKKLKVTFKDGTQAYELMYTVSVK